MGKKRVGNFRSNILGGFNRSDVIGYIEQLHKELRDLQEENELLRSKLPPEQPEDNNLELEPVANGSIKEPDDFEFSSNFEPIEGITLDEPSKPDLPDTAASEQHDEISPDNTEQVENTNFAPANQMPLVQDKAEQNAEKHIDVSVSNDNTERSGQSVSASKKTIKVRKKIKK